MSDSPPSDSQRPERDNRDSAPWRLERAIPLLLKRLLEAGSGRLGEGPEALRQVVADLRLPKEALSVIFAQLDETKNGLYRAVAREVREFLDGSNLSEELAKALTHLSFEIRTEIRFIPNDAKNSASKGTQAGTTRPDTPSNPEDSVSSPAPHDTTRPDDLNASAHPIKEDSE